MKISQSLVLLLCLGACAQSGKENEAEFATGALKYNLNQPDQKYLLSDDLEEISGLSYLRPGQLACIQDEEGKVFTYDLNEKEIVQRTFFGRSSDYEGIEVVDSTCYIIKSNGTLVRYQLADTRKVESEEIATALSTENNIEGLGYNPITKQLLIACKGEGGLKDSPITGKAIYAYDLAKDSLLPKPLLVIEPAQLGSLLPVTTSKKKSNKKTIFQPSGIAFHPIDHQYYILASEGKILVVLNQNGSIAHAVRLHPRTFKQPEGICFSPEGELFIASEGRGSSGYILRFKSK